MNKKKEFILAAIDMAKLHIFGCLYKNGKFQTRRFDRDLNGISAFIQWMGKEGCKACIIHMDQRDSELLQGFFGAQGIDLYRMRQRTIPVKSAKKAVSWMLERWLAGDENIEKVVESAFDVEQAFKNMLYMKEDLETYVKDLATSFSEAGFPWMQMSSTLTEGQLFAIASLFANCAENRWDLELLKTKLIQYEIPPVYSLDWFYSLLENHSMFLDSEAIVSLLESYAMTRGLWKRAQSELLKYVGNEAFASRVGEMPHLGTKSVEDVELLWKESTF